VDGVLTFSTFIIAAVSHYMQHDCTVYVCNAGKLISRHEDHIMWEESLLLRNLGPFSTFFYNQIRPFTGKLFSTVGNFIYHVLLWLNLSSDVK